MAYIVENTRFEPTYEKLKNSWPRWANRVKAILLFPFSFGKLVHQYMGLKRSFMPCSTTLTGFMISLKIQEKKDLELVQVAAGAPERLVIISDHADENLISPKQYVEYCCPFYQKANKILHDAGKFVSTHLDGNFKGYFPYLKETISIYSTAVTGSYVQLRTGRPCRCHATRHESVCRDSLHPVLPESSDERLLRYAERILKAFKGRGILNVGDILPPNGNIEQCGGSGRVS